MTEPVNHSWRCVAALSLDNAPQSNVSPSSRRYVPHSQSLPRFFGVRVTFALDTLLHGTEVEVID